MLVTCATRYYPDMVLCFAHVFRACYRFDFTCTHVYEETHEHVCTHAICTHEPRSANASKTRQHTTRDIDI